MNDTNVIPLAQPEQFNDALTEVLRDGAARLLAAAVEAEVEAHLAAYSDLRLPDGRQRIVRHTPLPEREVQTGIGPVKVKCHARVIAAPMAATRSVSNPGSCPNISGAPTAWKA